MINLVEYTLLGSLVLGSIIGVVFLVLAFPEVAGTSLFLFFAYLIGESIAYPKGRV